MSESSFDDFSSLLNNAGGESAFSIPTPGDAGTDFAMDMNAESAFGGTPDIKDLNTPIKTDDTWMTEDRKKAIDDSLKKLYPDQKDDGGDGPMKLNQASHPQLNLVGGMQPPPSAMPMQMPMSMAPMQLQAQRGRPLQPMGQFPHAFARGGAMHAMGGARPHVIPGKRISKTPMVMDRSGAGAFGASIAPSFSGGGMMMLHALNQIRDRLSKTPGQAQGALRTGMQNGPGNGQSDSIHAHLANGGSVATGDGEYVLPARTVAFWGGGSSKAGGGAFDHFVKHTDKLIEHEARNAPDPRKP